MHYATQWRAQTNDNDDDTDGNHSHNVHLDDGEKVLNGVCNGHRQLVQAETMQIVADDEQLGERVHRTKADHTAPVRQIGETGTGVRLSSAQRVAFVCADIIKTESVCRVLGYLRRIVEGTPDADFLQNACNNCLCVSVWVFVLPHLNGLVMPVGSQL